MKRRLFNAGALLSLLLAVLVIALWWRSHSYREGVIYTDSATSMAAIYSAGGRIYLFRAWDVVGFDWEVGWRTLHDDPFSPDSFSNSPVVFQQVLSARWVSVHYWLITAFAVIWPMFWCWSRWARGKLTKCCPACGYDLRGTPGSETCPECGEAREAMT